LFKYGTIEILFLSILLINCLVTSSSPIILCPFIIKTLKCKLVFFLINSIIYIKNKFFFFFLYISTLLYFSFFNILISFIFFFIIKTLKLTLVFFSTNSINSLKNKFLLFSLERSPLLYLS